VSISNILYGLTYVTRVWYINIDEHLTGFAFRISPFDGNLYVKNIKDYIMILVIYVNDIITINQVSAINEVIPNLRSAFDMIDLGVLHYCLYVEVLSTNGCVSKTILKVCRRDFSWKIAMQHLHLRNLG
jgi:hypothetical protein